MEGRHSANLKQVISFSLAVLLGLSLCIGLVTASISAGLPALFPMLFTPDRALWPLMRMIAPQVLHSALAGQCPSPDLLCR